MTKRQSEGGPPSPPQSSLAARGILTVPIRVPRVAGGRTVPVSDEVLSDARISRSAYIPPRLVGRRRVEPLHIVANYRRLRLRRKGIVSTITASTFLNDKPDHQKNCIQNLSRLTWYYMVLHSLQ